MISIFRRTLFLVKNEEWLVIEFKIHSDTSLFKLVIQHQAES